jgi:hypothetical protein
MSTKEGNYSGGARERMLWPENTEAKGKARSEITSEDV